MKLEIRDLILEVTRQCNMNCMHCLRGEPQNIHMSKEIVDAILDQVDLIGSLCLTGGEITLNIDLVEYIVDEIIRRDITLHSFYIVSNGEIVSVELAVALLKLNAYALLCSGGDSYSNFLISSDDYHDNTGAREMDYGIYSGLSFFSIRHNDYRNHDAVMNEGRAKEYNLGSLQKQEDEPSVELVEFDDRDVLIVDGDIYINARGNVVYGCDHSYRSQDKPETIRANVYDDLTAFFLQVMHDQQLPF